MEINEIDKQILDFLRKNPNPISKTKLAKELKNSTNTISKYVDILEVKGLLKVERYGNIHLVHKN